MTNNPTLVKARRLWPLLVVADGLLAYHDSFTGPFIYDDVPSIRENSTIRHLWPIWQPLSPPRWGGLPIEGRPLINLSLAINYALGGYTVWGYHALNLTVHILAGLTLLGIVRWTLLRPPLRERFGTAANELALATAVLWTVHPLQTESVTYIVQRAESIMGLFYLLTLYCFIRGVESPRARLWYCFAVAACGLGMASKEVMISAPLMVMLYDRAFVSGSFREAWRHRWRLYVALASTWILLGVVLASGQRSAASMSAQHMGVTWWQQLATLAVTPFQTRGIERFDFTWWQYLATEPGVILYYLRLAVWPHPLCFGLYGWPIANTWMNILPPALVMMVLLGATAWALKTNSAWGFLSAWFFLILAPSSSVIPLDSPAYEHRMYLSLAALVVLGVIGIHTLVGRRSVVVFVAVAIGLGFLTWRRNQDYRSELAIWSDTVAKFPNNARASNNLGSALKRAGRVPEAIQEYEQTLRIKPDYAETHYNLGIALQQAGQMQEAMEHYEQAVRLKPDLAGAHNNLGILLKNQGKMAEAVEHYEEALRIQPDYAEAHNNLAIVLSRLGRVQDAIGHWNQALHIDPTLAEAHNHLGVALEQVGREQEAIGHYEEALRLNPHYAEAHNNLGLALMERGAVQAAIEHWEQALRIQPDYADPHNNLGSALARMGRVQEAVEHWEQALRINPNFPEAHYNLGLALEQAGRLPEAIGHYEQALRIKPDFVKAQNKLAQLRAGQ